MQHDARDMRTPRLTWMWWAVAALAAAAGAACRDDALDPSGETVATVEVAPPTATVVVGATVPLTARALDAAGNVVTGRKVLWVSADPNFATVSETGVVTGKYVGTVPIAASVEGKTATAEVVVLPVPVASVRITPSSRDIVVGGSVRLTAEALDGQGAVIAGRPVTWTTGQPNVATVSGDGLVTGVSPGGVAITATIEGKSGVAAITVAPAPVASVSVSPSSATLVVGETTGFEAQPRSASGQPLNGRVVSWASNRPQVASVNATGIVFAVAPGTATITASSEGKSGSATVTVVAPSVHRVEVTPADATVDEGESFRLTATVFDSRGNVVLGQQVRWTSSDTRVATVDETGRVRGHRQGNVTITATVGDKSGSARVRVRDD
ncbi:MAG: hypothetical protein K0S86_5450 [Geminicoccaceae bacterium]|nr:hypothetical protein [Geminicoccaceae bacterium]